MRVPAWFLNLFHDIPTPALLMILTRQNLHAMLNHGSANRRQIEALGLTWPPRKGWLSALIGAEIAPEKYEKVRSLCRRKSDNSKPLL